MPTLEVQNPYNLRTLTELELTSWSEAFAKLETCHDFYSDRRRWLSKEARIEILGKLATLVEAELGELTRLAASEGGKPLRDSHVELVRAVSGIRKAQAAVSQLCGREISMDEDAASRGRWAFTYREPRGVVLALSAFNHPFNLIVHQAVTALAAGCPALVKPASKTPLSARRLVELIERAGAPAGFIGFVLPDRETTQALVADPRVAFLSFIGSSKVGWDLRTRLAPGAAAALEHGGVAPVIFDETADLEDALPLLLRGAFYHAGQVCVSVQRIFADARIAPELAVRLAERARTLRVGDPLEEQTEVGPLITPVEVERVAKWVKEAGGQILEGGAPLSETTYAPTVLYAADLDCELATKEAFGPVVLVTPYDDIDWAVEKANLPNAYFQAALFTNRLDRALDIGRRLHGMAVMVNDHTAFRVDWMPFGGHRESGLGVSGIEPSMREMTIERSLIFRAPR